MLLDLFWRTLRIPFVRDIATMQVGRVVYMGLTLASSVFFVRLLGEEQYGVYAVALAYASTFKVFLNFGQATSLQVFFAEARGRADRHGERIVLATYLQLTALTSVLLLALACVSPLITDALYADQSIGVLGACLFVNSILDLFNGGLLCILQALRHIRTKVWMEQSATALFIVSSIIALFWGFGPIAIFLCQLTVSAIFVVISAVIYHRLVRDENLPPLYSLVWIPLEQTWGYIKQSMLFSVDKNAANLFPSSILFALSIVAPATVVGVVRLALQLAAVPTSFLLPQVSELSTSVLAAMNPARIREKTMMLLKHATLLHVGISLAAMIVMPPLVPLVYGSAAQAAVAPMLIFIALSLLTPLTIVNAAILRLHRRTIISTILSIVTLGVMWGAVFVLQPIVGDLPAFYGAYAIEQCSLLLLAAYILTHLISKEPPARPSMAVIEATVND